MNTMYLDVADNSCTSVFIRDTEIIPAGITICSMPVKNKRDEYNSLAEKYDIHFIFDDNVPAIDFYSVPQIDIMAFDSLGGFLGTLGEMSSLDSEAPICYIDKDRNCFTVASDFKDLLSNLDNWKEKAVPCEEVVLFGSKEEAMKSYNFVDLGEEDDAAHPPTCTQYGWGI